MGTLKKVTSSNFKPTIEGDGRFPVYAQQFNAAISTLKTETAVTSLTDSTTGTATDTLNDTTASVKDDLASLAAKVNEIITALKAAGIIT